MNTRPATSLDARLLSTLSTDVQRLHAEHYPDLFKISQSEDYAISFFEGLLVDPNVHIFIAEENSVATGYIVCILIERPENQFRFATRYLHVDQISVRPEAQRKGTGAALIQQAELLAKELNVQRIHLDSWGFNVGAHAFFEKMGFEKFNHRFWKEL